MLVLSRDCDTAVRIGNGIRIKVLSIRRQRVKLGVEAPRDVRIWREEVPVKNPELDSTDTHPIRLDTTFDEADLRTGSDLPILVVENDPDHATLVRKIICGQGYNQIAIVSSGTEAMEVLLDGSRATAKLPHLVLLGYRLRDMCGDEFVRQVRGHPQLRAIPLVVLSTDQRDSVVFRCLEAGANAFVTKQADFARFQQAIITTVAFWLGNCRVPQALENSHDRNTRVVRRI